MNKKAMLLGVALIALVAGTPASADALRHGWYFGLEGGRSFVDDTSLSGPGYTNIKFESDFAGLGTMGVAHGDWRFELELGYRTNNIESINGVAITDGELNEWSGFVNFIYDVPISSRWLLDLGVGAGLDEATFDDHLGRRGSDTVFGIQGIAGLTYRVTEHWDLAFNYRYLWAGSPELQIGAIASEMDLTKHAVTLGLRYGYDDPPAPPPPPLPPPPPPPPAAKQFIVFFGFNKSNLTAEAQAVVTEAAAAAKAVGTASIMIVGHTDTVGSNDYNDKLSWRRAAAVKDELVRLGVSPDAITASGKGESELMVQTGDGVKEPQNRRATIDLK